MKQLLSESLVGLLGVLIAAEVCATTQTQIVARDIRKLGNGMCEASVTLRYNEPYQRLSAAPRLLRSSRATVPCAKAGDAANRMIQKLDAELLLQAQGMVNQDNTRVRSFTLAKGVPVREEATFRSAVLQRWVGSRVQARSVTPSWYAITDAIGDPVGGYFHVSAIVAEVAEPQPGLSLVTASCNARLRAAPSLKARVIKSLPCGQPLSVMIRGQDGWYEVVSAEGLPQGRYIYGTALKIPDTAP